MASPSSVCLGCRSVCSCVSCFLSLSLYACRLVLLLWWFRCSVSSLFVGALRLFSSCVVVLLPLAGAYVVGGFLRRGWLCMLRCLCLLFCFALPQRKPARCSRVQCMLASSTLGPVLLLLVQYCLLAVLVHVLVHAHEWRWRPLRLRSMSSCDAALLTQAPLLAHCLLPGLLPCLIIMADAAPAVPRQQRRKEARAQVDEDVRRVRQRMDDTDVRLDTLEGRLRGHDLRLQYLEAPLKLVLKKFKAPSNSGLPRTMGSRRPNPPFRLPFFKSFVRLVAPLFSIFWRRLSRSWRNWIRM